LPRRAISICVPSVHGTIPVVAPQRIPKMKHPTLSGFHGGTLSHINRRTTTVPSSTATTRALPAAPIRPTVSETFPTPRRSGVLRPAATGCSIWRATCGSGAGTGWAPTAERLIRVARVRAPTGCFGAAVGYPSRPTAVSRFATATTRTAASMIPWASARPAVQSHNQPVAEVCHVLRDKRRGSGPCQWECFTLYLGHVVTARQRGEASDQKTTDQGTKRPPGKLDLLATSSAFQGL
jgi:hypothetical protein